MGKDRIGGRVPDRWRDYLPVRRDIPGTRIVPFKTPLDSSFYGRFSDFDEARDDFSVQTMVHYASNADHKLGLVIDLTGTDRYYDASEWKRYGIEYVKMACPGRECPPESVVAKFIKTVDTFLTDSSQNGKTIGVHCTHGINRTGYMICRFLIDTKGWNAADAIRGFEEYRGYEIEREIYKAGLRKASERIHGK